MKTLKGLGSGVRRSNDVGRTDVIIVGAGVAGSSLAYALGNDGWCVHVIERDLTEPDRMVGELLQPGGYLKLIELGLEDCVDGIDAQITFGIALYMDRKESKLPFPSTTTGRSIQNGRFIQKMRGKAASVPNVKLEQGTVTALIEENGTIKGVRYKTKAGKDLMASAPLTIVCDGCFSNLRRFLCNPKIDMSSYFIGLTLENCDLPQENHPHFIVNDAIIIAYRISSNEIRCLVNVPCQKLPPTANGEMANYLKTAVAPQMPLELYTAFICAIDKGNIRIMQNRSMPASANPIPGAFLLGDALNMRHPLTGGGMTVALADVVLLRDILRPLHDLSDAAALHKYMESFYILRKPMASTINAMAGALSALFSASQDQPRKEMTQACFDYLCLGGMFSNGLLALVSGLDTNPLSLVFQFVAMAAYIGGRLLLPAFTSPKRMWTAAKLVLGVASSVYPVIKAEGIRQMFFPMTVPAYYRTPPDI